jgi:hypothetical protein
MVSSSMEDFMFYLPMKEYGAARRGRAILSFMA